MFWSKEEIYKFGFDSIEQFVEDYMSRHNNCCIMYYPDGVYVNYDYDTNFMMSNDGKIMENLF